MSDPILRAVLKYRKEEPETVREYIREMIFRRENNLEQVEPNTWFQAPNEWEAPEDAQQVYGQLSETNVSDSVSDKIKEE